MEKNQKQRQELPSKKSESSSHLMRCNMKDLLMLIINGMECERKLSS